MVTVLTQLFLSGLPEEHLPSPQQTKEDLEAGLACLRTRGWCQGKGEAEDGRVCAITALTIPFQEKNRGWFDDLPLVARYLVARRRLDEQSAEKAPRGYATEGFNDYVAKGQEDIEDLYEMAIADL